jgi:hypothetical protein
LLQQYLPTTDIAASNDFPSPRSAEGQVLHGIDARRLTARQFAG